MNVFQMQSWTNDSNTDLNSQPLDTRWFPANGSYITNWWPGSLVRQSGDLLATARRSQLDIGGGACHYQPKRFAKL